MIVSSQHVDCRSETKRSLSVVLAVTSTRRWRSCLFLATPATASPTLWIIPCLTVPRCSRPRISSHRARPASGLRTTVNAAPLCLTPRVFLACRPMKTAAHAYYLRCIRISCLLIVDRKLVGKEWYTCGQSTENTYNKWASMLHHWHVCLFAVELMLAYSNVETVIL